MPNAESADIYAPLAVAAVSGYLLGSLPFGFLVARSRGVNIFEVGSRSPGATNVRRVLGAGPGNAVFALDALKGAAAAGWPLVCAAYLFRVPADRLGFLGYAGLAAALVGHAYSCFTRFRGGKGVATAAGGLFVLLPLLALIALGVWTAAFYSTRFVSLASILAALSLPLSSALLGKGPVSLAVTGVIAAFVVVRHRGNIRRLMDGTEKRFERKAGDSKP